MAEPIRNYDFMFKILLIGDTNTGKTKILCKYAGEDKINGNPSGKQTIGIDFMLKTITIKDKRIKLQIWDTAGQERFRTITTAYYRGAMGILLVYDITQAKTFNSLPSWLSSIREYAPANVVISLVGNKCHKQSKREVPVELGEQFAAEHEMRFREVSCEMDINVEEVFQILAEDILSQREPTEKQLMQQTVITPTNENARLDKKGCC
ncbi:predicted protein [Nematostella vectensis]|uniref:Uncharacterized protein n=1 Tax=Nematostella vectensis TaxID=45351 RepID=A7SFQ5_NEMVE|nr:ras-related protein Rab-13 [Nematostella vectensis]EDO37448.1 predicted protein [Nematostella vectensis]|eukprot:XP_001629511.1 predicted protein [Nematostella vectensis]